MPATPTDDLLERLKDPEYAKLYGEENARVDFAITLTKARKSLNLTQRSLAEKLNISQPYVAKLEGGEANPTLGTIGRLLAAINLRLVTLTAPLQPEPASLSLGFVRENAADASEALSSYFIEAGIVGTAVGTMAPSWPAQSEPREALIGGAAR